MSFTIVLRTRDRLDLDVTCPFVLVRGSWWWGSGGQLRHRPAAAPGGLAPGLIILVLGWQSAVAV